MYALHLQINIYFNFTRCFTTSVTIIQTLNFKIISPIIDLNLWNAQETAFTLMKDSKMGNCAIVNNTTKKTIELNLRLLLQSMVWMISTI